MKVNNIKETEVGQIWSLRSSTRPTKNNIQPFQRFVQIVSEMEYDYGIYSVIVRPITFELEFKAQDDRVISDPDLFDDPFIIEYWNEQIMDATLLDELVGKFEVLKPYDGDSFQLTDEQKKFRSREIANTGFLRQEIFSKIFEQEEPTPSYNATSYLKIAASLLVIAMISFSIWNFSFPSDESLVSEFGTPVSHDINLNFQDNVQERGESCGIDNLEGDECDVARKALDFYENGNYREAAEVFSNLLSPRQKSDNLTFYMALSYFYSDQLTEAINHFNFLLNRPAFERTEDATFYLALSYLKKGERKIAREKFESIVNSDGIYAKKAEKILNSMRFF